MRLPEFGRVTGDWSDRPVIIVACGPSMAGFDLERLRGLGRVLAVKEMVFDIPWADEGFGLDLGWISKRRKQAEIMACPTPLVLAIPIDENLDIDAPPSRPGLTYIVRKRGDYLSTDSSMVHSGGTSGFGALNVAYLHKARDVYLFGYDYATPNGRHHHDDSRYPANQTHGHWPGWARKYNSVLKQVTDVVMRVTNASPGSSITAFPKVSHETALEMLKQQLAATA